MRCTTIHARALRPSFGTELARAVGLSLLLPACFALVTTGTAFGQTEWIGDGTGTSGWDQPGNWNAGVPNGSTDARFINKDGTSSNPYTINLFGTNGVAQDLDIWGSSHFKIQGDPGTTLSFRTLDINTSSGNNNGNNNSSNTTYDVDLIGSDTITQWRKCGGTHSFNRNVTLANELQTKSNSWNFGDGVGSDTFTFNGGLNVTFSGIASGSTVTANFNGTVVAPTITVGAASTYNAKSAGAAGDSSTTITVENGGLLNLEVGQSSLADISVSAFSALAGNMNGAIYSGGSQNVTLVADSILAPTGGPEPSETDLGLTPGVQDAILWKGATSTGTTSAGDDGNSVYKGVAVGQFTPNFYSSSNTYTTPTSGDLAVAMAHNKTGTGSRYSGAKFDSPTGVANIGMYGMSEITLRQSLKGTANEFHFHNEGTLNRTIVTFDLDAVTAAQAVHVHDGSLSIGNNAAPDIKGRLELHGDAMVKLPTSQLVPDANTVIVLNDNASVSVNTGEESILEQLTSGTNLIVNSATPVVYLESRGGGYDFTGATSGTPNPVMMQLLTASNLVVSSNNNNFFTLDEDLTLGDGKYFINYGSSHKGMTLGNVADPGQVIAEAGALSIGIANFGSPDAGSGSMKINATVDGGGTAAIRLGSTTALTGVRGTNQRATQIPSGTIELNASAAFVNTPEVAVDSGTVKLNAPMTFPDLTINATLNTSGNAVTVNGVLGGSGQVTGNGTVNVLGGVAPGVGIGALDAGNLSLAAGGFFELEIADPDDVGGAKGTGAGTGWDYLMTDTLALGGDWSITLANAGLTRNILATDEFLIATSGDGFAGITSLPTYNAPQGWTTSGATLDIVGNDLFLSGITAGSSAAVPEPSTFLLAALGLLGLALAGMRRRWR